MISSAVAIPEQPPAQAAPEEPLEPSSPSLKRRQSSPDSPDTNKRPRLDTSHLDGSQASPQSASASPLTNRKTSLVTPVEEKRRNQRLFSGLISTLSQTTSSKPQHKKRDEIEARQRERIRKDTEEREGERRRKRAAIDERRKLEQRRWEEEGRELKWQRMRAMASLMKTETAPSLYWRPWEMREEEKQKVERQKEQVEEEIRHEKEALGLASPRRSNGEHQGRSEVDQQRSEDSRVIEVNGNSTKPEDGTAEGEPRTESDDNGVPKDMDNPSEQQRAVEEPLLESKVKDDDHAEEELVEGEDHVIY